MPISKKTLITTVILLLIVVVISIYFVSKKNSRLVDQNIITTTDTNVSTSTLIWTKDEIVYSGKKILSIDDFPDQIEVAEGVYFGSSTFFTGAILSPDRSYIAITVSGGVHEFGWLYDLRNNKIIPVAFSFDGGVEVKRWKNNIEVVFNITSPKPAISEKVINTNSLPDFPRLKSATGAEIRKEMGDIGCPEMMIINKMPGPGASKEPYYIDNGKRVEISDYDPIWLKANCEVPVQEVY